MSLSVSLRLRRRYIIIIIIESDRLAACGVLLGVFLVYIIFVPLVNLRRF